MIENYWLLAAIYIFVGVVGGLAGLVLVVPVAALFFAALGALDRVGR